MKPEFLTQPAAWTRAPRTCQSAIDQACAVQGPRQQPPMDWQDVVVVVACVLALVALPFVLGLGS